MTPAIDLLNQASTPHSVHSYDHKPGASFGAEAAQALGLSEERVFKTLLVSIEGRPRQLAVCVLPVAQQLNLKSVAKTLGVKRVDMADPKQAQSMTGYLVGGISPLGQKTKLPTLIDQSAMNFPTLFMSAGRRGLELELAPEDLVRLTDAQLAEIAR